MISLSALFAGMIFGLGLLISGMADPAKVLGFLDLAGAWDPSLMLVMGGAVVVGVVGYLIAARRTRSLLGGPMCLPERGPLDRQVLVGSALFGVGWGLAGFCPGPALVALGIGEGKAVVFVLAMLVGMGLFEGWKMLRPRPTTQPSP